MRKGEAAGHCLPFPAFGGRVQYFLSFLWFTEKRIKKSPLGKNHSCAFSTIFQIAKFTKYV
jgi:hypothetical protein